MKLKMLTFSGVDGAGKTTILKEIKSLLNDHYKIKVVELRQRPSLLPILSSIKYGKKKAELKTTKVFPRSGKNTSKISSYIRFFYYLSDYLLGQWYVYFKYISKGYIVIYDRYYFDFIADQRRANLVINNKITKFFYNFVFKPEVNIFLYASADLILQRKQELSKETINELTTNYQNLFENEFSGSKYQYVCIENIDKDKVINIIKDILDRYL